MFYVPIRKKLWYRFSNLILKFLANFKNFNLDLIFGTAAAEPTGLICLEFVLQVSKISLA